MNNTNTYNLHPYAAQSYVQTLLVNLINMTFGFLAIIGNSLILYTIGKSRKLRENLCNLLIGVLAFADLLEGNHYNAFFSELECEVITIPFLYFQFQFNE
jgi:hypothetical protein